MSRSQLARKTPLSARKPMQRAKKRMQRDCKETRFRSPAYLAFVRSLPCAMCGGNADSAHHVIGIYGLSGMGLKAPDQYSIPVCDGPGGCHARIHAEPALQRLQPWWLIDTLNRGLDEFTEEPVVGALCEALELVAEREAE